MGLDTASCLSAITHPDARHEARRRASSTAHTQAHTYTDTPVRWPAFAKGRGRQQMRKCIVPFYYCLRVYSCTHFTLLLYKRLRVRSWGALMLGGGVGADLLCYKRLRACVRFLNACPILCVKSCLISVRTCTQHARGGGAAAPLEG